MTCSIIRLQRLLLRQRTLFVFAYSAAAAASFDQETLVDIYQRQYE